MPSFRLIPLAAVLSPLGIALLIGVASSHGIAGQASSSFAVTVELLGTGTTPSGVVCRSNPAADALVCRRLPAALGEPSGEPVSVTYGSSRPEDENSMWGAVAASRRVRWGGRDYLEMTLTW